METKNATIDRKDQISESSPKQKPTPMDEYKEAVVEVISNNESSVVIGETGSGKTTRMPVFIHEAYPDSKTAITQPRRVAATSVSKFVSSQMGYKIGQGPVGYQIRFEDHTNEGTKMNFMTDGILLRKIQLDPMLLEYDIVMVDEAHERSLNIDFLLGLLKDAQKLRKQSGEKELKIIISSATIEKGKFLEYFEESGSIEVPGRMYPIEDSYLENRTNDYTKEAARVVDGICSSGSNGDILIFMPGEEEIKKTIAEINKLNIPNSVVLPLFGGMAPEDQDKIFDRRRERRIIVSTNIAETSVTIDGVTHVIDSGVVKQKEYDPVTGIESLVTEEHAQSGLKQRRGRAGRTQPGNYYALYTKDSLERRPKFQKPELLRSSLSHIVLIMKDMGIKDIHGFDFIDKPEYEAVSEAIETLKILGALDEDENVTEIGDKMSDMPLKPELAKIVLEAEKYGCVESVCSIVSILSAGKSVFARPKDKEDEADSAHYKFKVGKTSDFQVFLGVWNQFVDSGFSDSFARENFLNVRQLFEIKEIRSQLIRELKNKGILIKDTDANPENIEKSIASGMIQNLFHKSGRFTYDSMDGKKDQIFIHPSSSLFSSMAEKDYIIGLNIVETSKVYARNCGSFKKKWFKEIAPQLLRKESYSVDYDSESDKFRERLICKIKKTGETVDEEYINVTDQDKIEELIVKKLLNSYDEPFYKNKQIVDRLNQLNTITGGVVNTLDLNSFYAEKISGCEGFIDALEMKDSMVLRLEDYCDPSTLKEIEEAYPDSIEINGHNISISYYNSEEYYAKVNLSKDALFDVSDSDFSFIGGKINKPKIKYRVDNGWYNSFESENIQEIKAKFDSERIQKQFEKFVSENRKQIEYKPLEEFSALEKVAFTKDINGKDIFAYPFYSCESNYDYDKEVYDYKFFVSHDLDENNASYKTQEALKTKKELDTKYEKEVVYSDSIEVLKDFGGHFRTMGNTGNSDYYVIDQNGNLREPDSVSYRKRYTSEGEKKWDIVRPEEIALSWSKGFTAGYHDFNIDHKPENLTQEQLRKIEEIQKSIEESWSGRSGMSGKTSPSIRESTTWIDLIGGKKKVIYDDYQDDGYDDSFYSEPVREVQPVKTEGSDSYNPFAMAFAKKDEPKKQERVVESPKTEQVKQQQGPREITDENIESIKNESREIINTYKSLLKYINDKKGSKLKDEKGFISSIESELSKLDSERSESGIGRIKGFSTNIKSYISKLLKENGFYLDVKNIFSFESLSKKIKESEEIFNRICEELGVSMNDLESKYSPSLDVLRVSIENKINSEIEEYFYEVLGEFIK